jgi:hypothetical protein
MKENGNDIYNSWHCGGTRSPAAILEHNNR